LMQKALADFHQTVIINLEKHPDRPGRFQRTVWADEKLTEGELVDFENFVRVSGQKYLEEMDDWLGKKIARRTSDFIPSNARIAGAGVYHFVRSTSRFQELTEIFGGYYEEQEDD